MLSGYPNDLYARELAGWRRREVEIDNKASGTGTKRRMTEVIWMNFQDGQGNQPTRQQTLFAEVSRGILRSRSRATDKPRLPNGKRTDSPSTTTPPAAAQGVDSGRRAWRTRPGSRGSQSGKTNVHD